MATLTTKYSVGDTVYHASTTSERKRHPCPDCQGTRKWKATSPAGSEYEFSCPRCAASYNSDRDLTLDYSAYVPFVTRLTIGSIQYNTAIGSYDSGARYMCYETGIGSGSVYDEARLFETEDEATKAAQAMADDQNVNVEWVATLYDKTLKISDYQLENAALKLAHEAKFAARRMLYGMGDLFAQIKEASGKDEILEAVEAYETYDWSRDKEAASEATEAAAPSPDIMDMHDKTIAMVKAVVGID
ncbi:MULTISPECIES: hypothetical protein [unclassified Mesorhizobium]|uniref:hypothetical protein n=1 Tax=unclassified Mesorhizobium TaxID=325217 RepID=UPI000FD8E325|nr:MULTISPECIES: hypothetical protein [unclassified Mesorhizobium]TGT76742.1 hypothetical protein EN809_003830 [Mesorhizobium sp. M2E.F.Ca.ET.166.01.1.1]TGW02854.1 hypothetical protein EN797_003830 [Mesorhizobium sp. M2E.F.Ca.ET.154.01.1.1]